jgi:hypothetical protein
MRGGPGDLYARYQSSLSALRREIGPTMAKRQLFQVEAAS